MLLLWECLMYKANNNSTALAKALYNTNKSFRTCANICVVFLQTHRAEGASNCVERHSNLNVATLPLYELILKWGVSVVFIAKALRCAIRVRVITCAHSAIDNTSKRVTRFTTMKQEKENVGSKGSESGKPRRQLGP